MYSKRFFIFIVVPMLIFALFGLTGCDKSDSGSNGKDGENVSISGGKNLVNDTIQEAREADGILISYAITTNSDGREQTSTATFGAKGEKYYFLINDEEIIYDLSGSTGMDMYTKDKSDTLWTKSSTSYAQMSKEDAMDLMNRSYEAIAMYMTSYSIYNVGGAVFVKVGTEKIAGHTCTKYKYSASLLDASISVIYWVEESTGICFKVGYEGEADAGSGSVSLTMTQYKETYVVNIPTEDQIGEESDCGHVDLNNDGICDLCDEPYGQEDPGTITLNTPVVEVNATGLASWTAITNATGYICKVNGVEKAKQTATTIQLNSGDTLQVKAVGDGDKKKDSDWCKQKTYTAEIIYDFSGLGFSSYIESVLKKYEEVEAGYYPDCDTYKCTNGDLIIYRDDSFIDIFSRNDGYTKTTLIYEYFDSEDTTDYELVNYKTNKKAYYADLAYSASGLYVSYNNRTTPVYANSQSFIGVCEYEILDYNEYKTEDSNAFELLNYTEYSGDIDENYLNTTYMDSSRTLSYLEDFSSKISYWKVERVNEEGTNYCDSKITIVFKESFSVTDYNELLICLRDGYGLTASEGSSFTPSSNDANSFNGQIKVYDFPYEGDGDYIADKYKLFGGVGYPYTLIAEYTYITSVDCGTYASYITTPEGLFRFMDGSDTKQLMIAPDGTEIKHILPPYKTLIDFEVTYTLDAESDAENEAEDSFVATTTVKKVGNYILFTTTREGGAAIYVVYKIDGEKIYLRSGYYGGSTTEWNDFEYYDDSYYNMLDVYSCLIGEYFEHQLRCTETGSETYLGEDCKKYSYEEDDYTYTYYVNEAGLTLRFVEADNGEYVCTSEIINYDDSVSSFTTQEQAIIDDSGISSYNGED